MIVAVCMCGRRYKVEDDKAGKVVRCGGCGELFTVPDEKKVVVESLVSPEATSILTGKALKKTGEKSASQRLPAVTPPPPPASTSSRRKHAKPARSPITTQQVLLLIALFIIAALVIWFGFS